MIKKNVLALLDHFESYICQALVVFLVITLFGQIALRATGDSLTWTEEIARFAFIWFILFGACYATRLSALNSGYHLAGHAGAAPCHAGVWSRPHPLRGHTGVLLRGGFFHATFGGKHVYRFRHCQRQSGRSGLAGFVFCDGQYSGHCLVIFPQIILWLPNLLLPTAQ